MRCRDVRLELLDRDVEALDDDDGARLLEHLETCQSCRTVGDHEGFLSAELRALAALAPPRVDVVARVASAIEADPAWRRTLVPGRQVAWAAAAAVIAATGVVAGTWAARPVLAEGVYSLVRLFQAAVAAGWPVARAGAAILALPWRVLAAAGGALDPVLALGSRMAPLIGAATIAGFAGTIMISSFIIARDLRRGRALPSTGDERVTS